MCMTLSYYDSIDPPEDFDPVQAEIDGVAEMAAIAADLASDSVVPVLSILDELLFDEDEGFYICPYCCDGLMPDGHYCSICSGDGSFEI